jgi:uncharacterized repeat protein (TIGR04138 family)
VIQVPRELELRIQRVADKDERYRAAAYLFVLEALEHTMRRLGRDRAQGTARHVGGRELLAGIREHALQEFGPLARTVFAAWGIHRTEDFGQIVFRLVEAKLLSRQETDTLEDFASGYDFVETFEREYRIERLDARS